MALAGGTIQVPVYDRENLGAGMILEGPAILIQLDCTTLLLSGQQAVVHETGSLLINDM